MVQTTIVNYVAGGEAYTAAEFNVDTILGFIIGQVPPAQNSLGVALFSYRGRHRFEALSDRLRGASGDTNN